MRVGRQLEFYKAAQKAMAIQDDVLRFTTILKNAGLGLWLVHDSISWAHSSGIVKVENVKDIVRRGFQCWFVALVASLVNDLHKLRWNRIKHNMELKALKAAKKHDNKAEIQAAQKNLKALEA
jgi:peroxin-11B